MIKRFLYLVFVIILPPLVVLGAGSVATWYLYTHNPQPKKASPSDNILTVRVQTVSPENQKVHIVAMGTVIPAQQVEIHPQVSGRIIKQSRKVVPGGLFAAGEEFARIDPSDYKLALDRSKTALENMKYQLKLEEGNQVVAKQEWEMLQGGIKTTEKGRDLALRKPQIEYRKSAVAGAESGVEEAQLNLERTVIKAPFNAIVIKEFIDPGQTVSPQTRIASLVGTDEFWVQVSVSASKLPFIKFPGEKNSRGADALIIYNTSTFQIKRKGYVSRLLGDLDPNGRMARCLVTIKDPLGLKEKTGKRLSLLLGSYVTVEIDAGELKDVFVIPRVALHEKDIVYIMDKNNCLEIRHVVVAWRLEESIVISEGLKNNDRIILDRIPVPIEGRPLKSASDAGFKQNLADYEKASQRKPARKQS